MKNHNKFIPIIVLLLFYLNVLRSAINLALVENNLSYLILGITAPLPFLISIILALIKLIKKKN